MPAKDKGGFILLGSGLGNLSWKFQGKMVALISLSSLANHLWNAYEKSFA